MITILTINNRGQFNSVALLRTDFNFKNLIPVNFYPLVFTGIDGLL